MKIIKPDVTSWLCPEDWRALVACAARVCYGSETGKRTAEELCSFLEKRNHLSMFRHGTKYFVFSLDDVSDYLTISRLLFSPYIGLTYKKTKKLRVYFVAMNVQAFMELTPNIHNELDLHEVSLSEFVEKVKQYKHPTAFALIRYTVCVTTQISTSRELNRTSPNNIAEQSTRYVSFGKRGGITICEPHWYSGVSKLKRFTARLGWRIAGLFYSLMMRMGLKAEDARGYLPLDAATRVVYTYNVFEWRHILELRLLGKTGKPHPNAKLVAQMIADELQEAIIDVTGNVNYRII